jgi:FtsP/CotA-like multicopper oxidase with cupredoxin domain/peroxiredoxin
MRLLRADQLRILCCRVSVVPALLSVISGGAHVLGAEPATQRALSQSYSDLYAKPESVRSSERPFIQAQAQYSGKGALVTTLRLGYSEQLIPADIPSGLNKPQRLRLRCYNGNMVGPTLRIRPGDKLAITIENDLPKTEPNGPCMPEPPNINTPHGFNCTNLHTHGLHVSPEEDDVFVEIDPCGSPYTYKYGIDKHHVAGTFWYHPHKHGSVSMQLTTGAAGALIVEGGLDEIPEIRDAFERIMVFQQLLFTPDPDNVVTPSQTDVYTQPSPPGVAAVTLINGQLHPVIRMRPGSVERWRFIHAGIHNDINIAVVKDNGPSGIGPALPLYEIAVDGIPRGKMTPTLAYELYPGYRWDVMVKAPYEPGQYFLIDQGAESGNQLRPTQPVAQKSYLAKIVVTGPVHPMKLPDRYDLAACVPSQFAPVTDDEIKDSKGTPRICAIQLQSSAAKFLIDKCEYDRNRIDRVAWLDTAEEWHITANSHPFHIHVNPFEQPIYDSKHNVVDHIWRDTLFVNSGKTGPVTIRMRFKDFSGKTVLHCHILDHEDQGMMENFLLLPHNQPLGNRKVRVKCDPALVQQCVQPAGAMRLKQKAPDFDLVGTDGRRHRLADFGPGPVVVVFFRGLGCLHCVEQLQLLRAREPEFRKRHAVVLGVSSDSDGTLQAAYKSYTRKQPFPILLLADGSLRSFKAFGCWNGEPLHGTFVLDRAHRVVWQHSGEQPFMNLDEILKQCARLDVGSKQLSTAN